MSVSWQFFVDPGLAVPLAELSAAVVAGGHTDARVHFGSLAPTRRLQAASDPGVDQITVSVEDAATGTGMPATSVKLALTQAGLDAAVGGAALAIGAARLSGVDGALAIWVRVDAGATALGEYTDLRLVTNNVIEAAV